MASRRNLKKTINDIAGELYAHCMILKGMLPAEKQEAIDQVLVKVIALQNELISRISHTEPGNVKGFYKKLYQDFDAQVYEVLESLKALSK